MDTNPDTLCALWIHRSDAYTTPWGDGRKLYYANTYIPIVWIDGLIVSTSYQSDINARLAVPTDVVINIGANQIDASTFLVNTEVCVEPGGIGKTMRLHVVALLEKYPLEDVYYRNCVRQGFELGDVTVGPGSCAAFEQTITFDATSWANQSDIKVAAFVHDPLPGGPAEVYQSAIVDWPLPDTMRPIFSNGAEDGTPDGWGVVVP
jgi:hypothetical protein